MILVMPNILFQALKGFFWGATKNLMCDELELEQSWEFGGTTNIC